MGAARGDELPAELVDRGSRRARLARCKEELEAEQAAEQARYGANLCDGGRCRQPRLRKLGPGRAPASLLQRESSARRGRMASMAGERVPGVEAAWVPPAKLRDYALDPASADGAAKARVFASSLGITREDWAFLASQLTDGVQDAEVEARREDRWGARYRVTIPVRGRNDRVLPVRAIWFVAASGDRRPRLVTAYVDLDRPWPVDGP